MRFDRSDERQTAAQALISRDDTERTCLIVPSIASVFRLRCCSYLIDREALLRRGKAITGDKIVALKPGPVLGRIFDLVCQKKPELAPKRVRRKGVTPCSILLILSKKP